QSRDGAVWAGTLSGGVSRFAAGKFTTYSVANGLGSNTDASILETSDCTMWFATPAGLRSFSRNQWRAYTVKDGLPSDNVNCFVEDSRGVLWVGTAGGLAFLSAGGVELPRGGPDYLKEPVFSVAEDHKG